MLSKLIGQKENNVEARKELDRVKTRLNRVERRIRLLDAQVKVIQRTK